MKTRFRHPLALTLSIALAASVVIGSGSHGATGPGLIDSLLTAFPVAEAQFALQPKA